MLATALTGIYALTYLGLGIYGLHILTLVALYLIHNRRRPDPPSPPDQWPSVTVQLPIYNEPLVVGRLIDAVCALDYPAQALSIQVVDDSTDATTRVARQKIAEYRMQGVDVCLLRRSHRDGYKGGALAAAFPLARGELIAVLDADFVAPPDFLKQIVPHLMADPGIGMVQARWGHLNAETNAVTRSQALSLDGQLVVVQTARDRSGLFVKFNGSGGIWRRACIEHAGGWQGDTLTEDLDLSFRAQMAGWRLIYRQEIVVPAELPPQLVAFKRQQYRWAYGSTQVLRKLGWKVFRSPLPLFQRIEGLLHLSAYAANGIALSLILLMLPVLMLPGARFPAMPWVAVFGLGAPALFTLSQRALYPNWRLRLAYFPFLALLGVGLGLNNTRAVISGWRGAPLRFERTPKYRLDSSGTPWKSRARVLTPGGSGWGELALALYCLITATLAWSRFPRLVPALAFVALGNALVAGWPSLVERYGR